MGVSFNLKQQQQQKPATQQLWEEEGLGMAGMFEIVLAISRCMQNLKINASLVVHKSFECCRIHSSGS